MPTPFDNYISAFLQQYPSFAPRKAEITNIFLHYLEEGVSFNALYDNKFELLQQMLNGGHGWKIVTLEPIAGNFPRLFAVTTDKVIGKDVIRWVAFQEETLELYIRGNQLGDWYGTQNLYDFEVFAKSQQRVLMSEITIQEKVLRPLSLPTYPIPNLITEKKNQMYLAQGFDNYKKLRSLGTYDQALNQALERKRIIDHYLQPVSPMLAYQGSTMPKLESPMLAHQGSTMPKPESPMLAYKPPTFSKLPTKIRFHPRLLKSAGKTIVRGVVKVVAMFWLDIVEIGLSILQSYFERKYDQTLLKSIENKINYLAHKRFNEAYDSGEISKFRFGEDLENGYQLYLRIEINAYRVGIVGKSGDKMAFDLLGGNLNAQEYMFYKFVLSDIKIQRWESVNIFPDVNKNSDFNTFPNFILCQEIFENGKWLSYIITDAADGKFKKIDHMFETISDIISMDNKQKDSWLHYIWNFADYAKKFPSSKAAEYCKSNNHKFLDLIKRIAGLPDTYQRTIKEVFPNTIDLNPNLIWKSPFKYSNPHIHELIEIFTKELTPTSNKTVASDHGRAPLPASTGSGSSKDRLTDVTLDRFVYPEELTPNLNRSNLGAFKFDLADTKSNYLVFNYVFDFRYQKAVVTEESILSWARDKIASRNTIDEVLAKVLYGSDFEGTSEARKWWHKFLLEKSKDMSSLVRPNYPFRG